MNKKEYETKWDGACTYFDDVKSNQLMQQGHM